MHGCCFVVIVIGIEVSGDPRRSGVDTWGPRNTELTMRELQGRQTANLIQLKSVKVASSALGQCYNMKDNISDSAFIFKATHTSLYH